MSLITVGTMAFDAIETPFGKVDKIIGGSATYVAYAAANFIKPIQQISIIGYDFPQEELDELKARGVELDGVETVADKKVFFLERKVSSRYEYPRYFGDGPECARRLQPGGAG